jgi:hypothetical protein
MTVILVVTAMLHFSVAQHYCGGEMVASKVSLSGSLATCGMESSEEVCHHGLHGDLFESHCCDDVLTSISIDNNYTPVTKAASGFDQTKLEVPVMPFEKPVRVAFIEGKSWSDISPPGEFLTSSVDLPQIMVFRI